MMPFLGITLILLLLLAGRLSSLIRKEREADEAFFDKERQANMAVEGKKTLEELPYIHISIERLIPNDKYTSASLAIQDELLKLARLNIVNLNGITNTDLKLTYGVTNFDEVSEYGENFTKLETLLDSYCKSLIAEDKWQLAMTVAEFAVGNRTDISSIYMSLIDCYRHFEKSSMIDAIRAQVEASNMLMRVSILDYIDGKYKPDDSESSEEEALETDELNQPVTPSDGIIQIRD